MAKRKDQAEGTAGAAARPKRPPKVDSERAAIARDECARVAAAAAERAAQAVATAQAVAADQPPPRPRGFDQATADRILDRIAEGESVRRICRDPAMPSKATVFVWLRDNPTFAEAYAKAKDIGLQLLADELLDIADDGENDTYRDANGNVRVDTDHVQRSKIRLETRRWLLERMDPKKYGTSSTVHHKGAIGVAPIEMEEDQAKRVAQAILDGCAPPEAAK